MCQQLIFEFVSKLLEEQFDNKISSWHPEYIVPTIERKPTAYERYISFTKKSKIHYGATVPDN